MWGLAVLAYEIWTYGELPYKGMTNQMVLTKVLAGFRLSRPDIYPADLWDIVVACWNADYHTRPTFKQLRESLQPLVVATGKFMWICIKCSSCYVIETVYCMDISLDFPLQSHRFLTGRALPHQLPCPDPPRCRGHAELLPAAPHSVDPLRRVAV